MIGDTRNNILVVFILIMTVLSGLTTSCKDNDEVSLKNRSLDIRWEKGKDGYHISRIKIFKDGKWKDWGNATGTITVLSATDVSSEPVFPLTDRNGDTVSFPSKYKYVYGKYKRAISEVPLNTAGKSYTFYPDTVYHDSDTSVVIAKFHETGEIYLKISLSSNYPDELKIKSRFLPSGPGLWSVATYGAAELPEKDLSWGIIPGFYQGDTINEHIINSYIYGQGLPHLPVLCRESTITAPVSILTDKSGNSMAVIVEPGQGSKRYNGHSHMQDKEWRIALSHMNRAGQLAPTAYHPILGEAGSQKGSGDTLDFEYRMTFSPTDWYPVYKHTVYDIYDFPRFLDLKESGMSLSSRLINMRKYVDDDKTSFWRKAEYQGDTIGAQLYMGGVAGSDHDAIKNSDIGAVLMLSDICQDNVLQKERIPYIRNFKIAQQDTSGYFKGAAEGQYFLMKSKRFVEEWGNQYEPVGLTYYTLTDIANMLLFYPDDKELVHCLEEGAERLLAWQEPDGSWQVAFDRDTKQPMFTDLSDLRPTFYGMYVAYRILHKEKYLDSAIKGADWYIDHAVRHGHFTGVCGDVRFVNDFATIQCAQALLDIYEITQDVKYRDAALKTARMYLSSIYTWPAPDRSKIIVDGREREDWQISQLGLGFEHGGSIGSAVDNGPILLASHSGFFVKLYGITGDRIFLDYARAGAIGRDAFVNPDNKVASYYWTNFGRGPGEFPHHAWWQIGWIMDYIVSEAELRSDGRISFPRGFMTPKVGPHKALGFQDGMIDGRKVSLRLPDNTWTDNSNTDFFLADDIENSIMFLVLLNQTAHTATTTWEAGEMSGRFFDKGASAGKSVLDPWGIEIIEIPYKTN